MWNLCNIFIWIFGLGWGGGGSFYLMYQTQSKRHIIVSPCAVLVPDQRAEGVQDEHVNTVTVSVFCPPFTQRFRFVGQSNNMTKTNRSNNYSLTVFQSQNRIGSEIHLSVASLAQLIVGVIDRWLPFLWVSDEVVEKHTRGALMSMVYLWPCYLDCGFIVLPGTKTQTRQLDISWLI